MPPPPPPGGGQQPPAGYVAYSPYYGGAQRQHAQGTTILVLGILSLAICGLLGPFAWSMGQRALREIDSDPSTTYSNRGQVNAGRICGIVSTCLLAVGVLIAIAAVASR
jgi:hypothetical protein